MQNFYARELQYSTRLQLQSLDDQLLKFQCFFLWVFPGEKGTLTHGALVDGKFDGFIQSYQGTYYVEPVERYLEGKNVPFHSVIYHEDDIREFSPRKTKHTRNASAVPFSFPFVANLPVRCSWRMHM